MYDATSQEESLQELVFLHMGGKINDSCSDEFPGWYFWDEAYDYHGPFATKEECVDACKAYAQNLLCSIYRGDTQ